jgi:hypothetical protein
MVNNPSIPEISQLKVRSLNDRPVAVPVSLKIAPKPQEVEEKVEVLIKESVRINPRDFSAFKHALEEFVDGWDK